MNYVCEGTCCHKFQFEVVVRHLVEGLSKVQLNQVHRDSFIQVSFYDVVWLDEISLNQFPWLKAILAMRQNIVGEEVSQNVNIHNPLKSFSNFWSNTDGSASSQ
jgi:hypothetical protein